jgi:hypothetical protein
MNKESFFFYFHLLPHNNLDNPTWFLQKYFELSGFVSKVYNG